MSGDGRLDLDDLGEVIDHASALDDGPRTEVLDDGNGPSLAERLESAGITPWARRHRRALAVAGVAVLVVVGGVVAYPKLVPPPVDPELRVTAVPVIPSQFVIDDSVTPFDQVGIFATGSSLRSAYALTKNSPDDTSTYRIDGLVGPMVRASTATPQPAAQPAAQAGPAATQVARADVDVVLDCFDGTTLPVPQGSYFLQVTRTDALGRTLTGRVPVDNPTVTWPEYASATCLQVQGSYALTPTAVRTSVDRATRTVTVDVDVTNDLRVPATLSVDQVYGVVPIRTTMTPRSLLPLEPTTLTLAMQLLDCNQSSVPFVGRQTAPGSNNYDSADQGLFLVGDVGSAVVNPVLDPTGLGGRVQMPLTFPPALVRPVDAALGSLCAGGPGGVIVGTERAGEARKVTAPFTSGNPEATRIPVVLDVVVVGGTDGRVRLSLPQPGQYESETARLRAVSAPVVDGRATVRTELDVDCAGGFVPPPTLQVDVTTARGTFPRQTQLTSAALAERIAAACPTIGAQQLTEFGWEDARVAR